MIVHRSDRSGVAELSVTIHEFDACAPASIIKEQGSYHFWYRPRVEKGYTWATVPELGLSHYHNSRDHLLVCPPFVPVYGGWEGAAGRVAGFRFSPRFFEAVADQVGLLGVKGRWHDSLAIDQRLEALCWLLMEETEAQCPHGPLYFEPLARALAVGVLSAIRDKRLRKARAAAVPPGIRRVIQCLETDFANNFPINELAAMAKVSRGHFALSFRRVTGFSPHQYLLRVRLSYARKLIAQGNPVLSLAEIAAVSGFFDQSHLDRVFQRFFGTTPSHFRSQQDHWDNKSLRQ